MALTRRRLLASLGGGGIVGSTGCLEELGSSTLINVDFESRSKQWDRRSGARSEDAAFDYEFTRARDRSFRRNYSLRVETDAPSGDGTAWVVRRVPLDHNYRSFTMSVTAWSDPVGGDPHRQFVAVLTDEDVVSPRAFPGSPDQPATADGETYGGFREPLGSHAPRIDWGLVTSDDDWITNERGGWTTYEREVNWISDANPDVGYFAVGIAVTEPGWARNYLDDIRLKGSY